MAKFSLSAFEDKISDYTPPARATVSTEPNPMVDRLRATHEANRWREIGPLNTKAYINDGDKDGHIKYVSEATMVERYIRRAARELGLGVKIRRSEPDDKGRQTVYYIGTDKRPRRSKEEVEAAKTAIGASGEMEGQRTLDEASGSTEGTPDGQAKVPATA